ncbi:MAG: DUF1570 domain-containing protein [Candidatus Cloacimonetes bacterium]|nr:DUF1570 domain-containing protein [Candidatus Cloacimonadota bacterium]MCF7814525.1 DUF1570 domain-containing protein [Candidatus Cloacimonadota bacterium]MCF7867683.1 DUF1570 domain-containing protein [Candidatus Cloacimonadota bacterium]MCF7883519.1 DUF1570 domain-containing protein [Candidatus Cloacimonadota bacterium]
MNFNKSVKLLFLVSVLLLTFCSQNQDKAIVQIDQVNCNLSASEWNFIKEITKYEIEFYEDIFSGSFPEIKMKIFGDTTSYRNFQKKISTSRSKNGFYSQSEKVIVINKNDRYLKTVSHEINHFILRSFIPVIPKWINEGLSEYFEYAILENDLIKIKKQAKKETRLKEWIHETDKIDLEDFLAWSNNKWREVNSRPDFYSSTLSWGIVYFFQNDDFRKNILKELLRKIDQGKDSNDIINELYPGGMEQLKIDFFIFVDLNL